MKYRLVLNSDSFWFYSNDLVFLIEKVEFFYSFRDGVRNKPYIVETQTGLIIYD